MSFLKPIRNIFNFMVRADTNQGIDNLLKGMTGHIGKKMVFKQYGDKTVVTAYPNMNRRKKTALQTLKQGRFKEAVAYAQNIVRNPELKQQYQTKVKKYESVYHYAIKEYLARFKEE